MTKDFLREAKDLFEIDDKKYIIPCLVDFDGTIVKHEYPNIGEPVPFAIELMKEYIEKFNVGWILDTMRSGKLLNDAIRYIESNGIKLYGIGVNPTQKSWTDSTKPYGVLRWDDNSAGVPMIFGDGRRPYLDWNEIDKSARPILDYISKNNNLVNHSVK